MTNLDLDRKLTVEDVKLLSIDKFYSVETRRSEGSLTVFEIDREVYTYGKSFPFHYQYNSGNHPAKEKYYRQTSPGNEIGEYYTGENHKDGILEAISILEDQKIKFINKEVSYESQPG